MDYIFIIGPSAVGKTTLAKKLYNYYNGVYFEQNMVPEFSIPEKCSDPGLFEEETCFQNSIMQLKFFYESGFRNIIALDFDDVRVRELPLLFKGYRFIIIRLISSDEEQIRNQMIHRHNNEGGLYDLDMIAKSNFKIRNRELLPNEVVIDVANKDSEEVFKETVIKIDNFNPQMEFEYELDSENKYYSWVKSRNLR